MTENQFGHYVNPSTVERDMISHLQLWMPTYLGQMERDMTLPPGSLKVDDWSRKTRLANLAEEAIPKIVVVSPGTHGKPYKHAHKWCAKWLLRVTAVCSADDEITTRDLAHAYLTAMKLIILQYQRINENPDVEGAEWDGDNYNLLASTDARSIAASQATILVEYKNVADEGEGPTAIAPDPENPQDPGPWPTVGAQGAKSTITKK